MRFASAVSWLANSIPVSAIANFASAVRANALNQMAPPTAAINMSSQQINNLGAPTANSDAATKAYADSVGTAANTYADNASAGALASAKTYTDSKTSSYARVARGSLTGDGSKTVFPITHGLGVNSYTFTLTDGSTGELILADMAGTSSNSANVTFATPLTNGQIVFWVIVG